MATGLSTYLANKLLDKALRNTDFTITTVYASLHTGDPADNGANECTGGSYARVAMEFDAAATRTTDNTNAESFTGMPSATVTHVGLWDASVAGNFLWGAALTASKVVNSGDTFQFPAGDVDVTLNQA